MNLKAELDKNVNKMRSYDRIICFTDFNMSSGFLTVSFANRALFSVFDVKDKKSFFWNLPKMDRARPLCISSDLEKMVVCYDSNLVTVFDLLNRTLHDWSRQNGSKFPANFLNRYNRFTGAVQVSTNKYILYTNYTYTVVNLDLPVPEGQVKIIQNHPGKSMESKQAQAESNWFDNLKLSQADHLDRASSMNDELYSKHMAAASSQEDNLVISNKLKGILLMSYD